jgi:hypothetical protein
MRDGVSTWLSHARYFFAVRATVSYVRRSMGSNFWSGRLDFAL